MSELIVEVCKIDSIRPHDDPEVERLEIAMIKGWEIVVGKGTYSVGDTVIYVPVDSLIPRSLAQKLNIEQYLTWNTRYMKDAENPGPDDLGRVRAARLRGVVSYGTTIQNTRNLPIGTDVAEMYGIKKWEPPIQSHRGQPQSLPKKKLNPLFYKYYDMNNIRHYPKMFIDENGDPLEVVMTEKLHGMNNRLGLLRCMGKHGYENELVIGSHNCQVRRMQDYVSFWTKHPKLLLFMRKFSVLSRYVKKAKTYEEIEKMKSQFEQPLLLYPQIESMLHEIYDSKKANSVILFGEVYGAGLQDLNYGEREVAFRAFDISVNNKYLNYDEFIGYCEKYNIPVMPELYRGPYSLEKAISLASGLTTLMTNPGKKDIIEGVVVRSVVEPQHSRKIAKCINPDYLLRKNPTEEH